MNKAINGLNFSLLKKFQPHRLAYPLAFAMSAKCFDELNRPCRFFNIKNPRVSWVVEFVNKFLILLNEAFTSNNFARLDFIPIFEYIICPAHFLAFFTKAMSSSSVDLFLSSGNRSIKHHIFPGSTILALMFRCAGSFGSYVNRNASRRTYKV